MDRIDLPKGSSAPPNVPWNSLQVNQVLLLNGQLQSYILDDDEFRSLGVSLLDGKLKKERHAILSGANDGFCQSFDKIGEINPCHYWLVRPNEAIAPE